MSSMHFNGGGYRRGRHIERGLAALAVMTLGRRTGPSSTGSTNQSQGDDHGTESRNAR